MGKELNPAGLRHIETEQRRRDRINEGYAIFSSLLCGSAVYMLSVDGLAINPSTGFAPSARKADSTVSDLQNAW